jgi:DNA-binding response OmpR family regulator
MGFRLGRSELFDVAILDLGPRDVQAVEPLKSSREASRGMPVLI